MRSRRGSPYGPAADVSGSITLDRLSLPWLVTTLALNAPADPRPNALWSPAKFGQGSKLLTGGQATFRVRRVDMGRGLVAENAGFSLGVTEEGLSLREFDAVLGGGRVTGVLSVTRQGPLASIVAEGGLRDVPLAALAGPTHAGRPPLGKPQGRRYGGVLLRARRQSRRRGRTRACRRFRCRTRPRRR